MWNDFKKFAFQGNIFDLAVAVVIGAAFSKIVTSLVEHIITPLIGILSGGINLSGLSYTFLKAEIQYGAFIQSVIDFVIISGSIFLAIRFLVKFKKKEEPPVEEQVTVDAKEELLKEIRDLLKEQR